MESTNYRMVRVEAGIFDVFSKAARTVRTVRTDATGNHEVPPDKLATDLAAALSRRPYFRFAASAVGDYHVDLDAGFQRWAGHKSGRAVGHALRACGFDAGVVRRVLAECRQNTTYYMGRVAM